MGKIVGAYPQRSLIFRSTAAIAGIPIKLHQAADPHATDLKGTLQPGGHFPTEVGTSGCFSQGLRQHVLVERDPVAAIRASVAGAGYDTARCSQ